MTATINSNRKSDVATLHEALVDLRTRTVDVVAPASRIRANDGNIVVEGVDPVLDNDGVTDVNGLYRPTEVGLEGVGAKLDVPVRFLTRSRDVLWMPGRLVGASHDEPNGGVSLFDHTVNALLLDKATGDKPPSYLLRLLKARDGGPGTDGADGVLRAFLSDSYRTIDNLDVLLAALGGLGEAGLADGVEVEGDLTDRKMIVRVRSTKIAALAPKLLAGYRSPFGGHDVGQGWTPERVANAAAHEGSSYAPGTEPVVFAGFVFANSEVGAGALDMRPRLSVRVCRNGLTINAEAIRKIHLGGKLDEGAVRWSDATVQANVELVRSQVRDAATTWLSEEFLTEQVEKLEQAAGAAIGADVPEVIKTVSKKLGFTDETAKGILSMFIRGGDLTASGVMHAVTAQAQVTENGDTALDMEMKALDAMALAAATA